MRFLRLAVSVCAIAALAALPLGAQDNPPLRLMFFSLDRGQASLLEAPGGATVLVGAGGVGEGKSLVQRLKKRGVKRLTTLVVNTWKDAQTGGAMEILKALPVGQLLHSPIYVSSDVNHALYRYAKSQEKPGKFHVVTPAPGEAIALFHAPPCRIAAVGPTGPMQLEFRNDPNCSMVLEVTYDRISILDLGDTQVKHQRRLWHTAPRQPDGEVLVIGRNGGEDALLTSLLKPLRTRVAIIPVARKSGRKPAASLLAALRKAGVKTYRTDTHGTITLETTGREIHVKTNQ